MEKPMPTDNGEKLFCVQTETAEIDTQLVKIGVPVKQIKKDDYSFIMHDEPMDTNGMSTPVGESEGAVLVTMEDINFYYRSVFPINFAGHQLEAPDQDNSATKSGDS
uniref:Uncharacterized protein n=1 Tax=Timema poppense TaxID=170557 RepID=A0A7R9H9Q8_TIMPO|nr:unnamed protein product [Timema poppensis]